MSKALILNFSQVSHNQTEVESQIRDIFFMTSSKKEFHSQKEKEEFEWKYLGFYLKNFPDFSWICVDANIVVGYILGIPYSQNEDLYKIQPHLKQFESYFVDYPAHLHINCRPEAQGKGVGKQLIMTLLNQLSEQKIRGVHIMTGTTSLNRHFYLKMGFDREIEHTGILFMGAKL